MSSYAEISSSVTPTAVVGGGITGLITAYSLLNLTGETCTVYTRDAYEDTVSWVAGGWVFPFHATDPKIAGPYAHTGDQEWRSIGRQGRTAGVVSMPCVYVTLDPQASIPEVVRRLPGYRPLEQRELPPIAQGNPDARGFAYDTVVVQMPIFLHWLTQQLHSAGVQITTRDFANLDDELATIGHRVVVTAIGLERRTLLNDTMIYPVRGDLILTRIPPEFTPAVHFLELPDGSMSYAIPYPDLNMMKIGGTYERVEALRPSSPPSVPTTATLDGIRRRLHLSMPVLAPAILASEYGTMTGFRPVSDVYRLTESIVASRSGRRIYRIDTDGPGGSGVTIAPAVGQIAAGRVGELLWGGTIEPAM